MRPFVPSAPGGAEKKGVWRSKRRPRESNFKIRLSVTVQRVWKLWVVSHFGLGLVMAKNHKHDYFK